MVDDRLSEAVATCVGARERWLIADPLRHAEVEREGVSAPVDDAPIEVDVVTKARQTGGVRREALVDIRTAVHMKRLAARIEAAAPDRGASMAVPRAGVRPVNDGYVAWSSSVLRWIGEHLTGDALVLVVDVADYFRSIDPSVLETALDAVPDQASGREAFALLRRIGRSASMPGLAVCPDDLVWIAADLVLAPVDARISALAGVRSVARWVDDIFVAVDRGAADRVLTGIERALAACGLQLARHKTAEFADVDAARRHFHADLHRELDDAFALTGRPADDLDALLRRLPDNGARAVPVVDRTYRLARRGAKNTLLARADADLLAYPAAATSILGYLGSRGWPEGSGALLARCMENPDDDARTLSAFRAAVAWGVPAPAEERVRAQACERGSIGFASALASTLRPGGAPGEALGRASSYRGALARRLAYAAAGPGAAVEDLIRADPSPNVRGLAELRRHRGPWPTVLRRGLDRDRTATLPWGGLDARLARAWIGVDR